ncbi:putative nuclease harbi1 [Chytriomyces hyalinus]|nr:putative nuclease harbi1 [Chytriomyces hyalinus]
MGTEANDDGEDFAIVAAVAAVVAVTAAVATEEGIYDWRSERMPRKRLYSMRLSQWKEAQQNDLYDDGWFTRNLRCRRATFELLSAKFELEWTPTNPPLGHNAVFSIRDRVAVTLNHLTSGNAYHTAGSLFGMSRTRACQYIAQVIKVIVEVFSQSAIKLPSCEDEWRHVAEEFKARTGISNIAGALDGKDSCHILFVLDPAATSLYIIGHGYQFFEHVMTPFPIFFNMPQDEAKYNYHHSAARIVVEQAFGLYKGRFQIFKKPMVYGTPEFMRSVIIATMVLHNWLIDFKDNVPIDEEASGKISDSKDVVDGEDAKESRDWLKEFINNILY